VSYQYQPENAIPISNFIDDPNDTGARRPATVAHALAALVTHYLT
jgi:TFIIF-interacting CTD phosphatase-like protein